MQFVTDPVGQVLLLSAFLLEKGDISSLLNIVLFYLRWWTGTKRSVTSITIKHCQKHLLL